MKALINSGIFSTTQRYLVHQTRFSLYATQAIRPFHLKKHRENIINMHPSILLPKEPISCKQQRILANGNIVLLKIYKPKSLLKKFYPTVFFVHGTGYVMDEHVFSDLNARYLSLLAQCQVINVHHSVAPEAPYPVPLNEVIDTYNYIAMNYKQLNVNRQKFLTLGYSSGTTLLAELAVEAKNNKKLKIKSNILVAPFVDFSGKIESEESLKAYKAWGEQDNTILPEFIKWVASLYIPKRVDLTQPSLSPYLHSEEELSGMSQTEIIFGNKDRVSQHAIGYARKLLKAGVPVNLHIAKNENHSAFWTKLYFIHYVAHVLKQSFPEESVPSTYKKDANITFFSENKKNISVKNERTDNMLSIANGLLS